MHAPSMRQLQILPAHERASLRTSLPANLLTNKPACKQTNRTTPMTPDVRFARPMWVRLGRLSGGERELAAGRRQRPLQRRRARLLAHDAQEAVAPTAAVCLEGDE